MNLDFLKSSRFWSLFIGALVIYLKTKGYIGDAEMLLVNTILGGFIVIRTIDRNVGDAKMGVTTVSMPANVSNVQATTNNSTTGSTPV